MLFPVKICGITSEEDAAKVAEAGADYLGVIVDFPASPRSLTLEKARSIRKVASLPVVVLISHMDRKYLIKILNELQPYALQFIGEESPAFIHELKTEVDCVTWKSFHFPVKDQGEVDLDSAFKKINLYIRAGIDALVLDTFDRNGMRGGTGKVFNWEIGKYLIQQVNSKVFLAGGITPHNVKEAIEGVRPYGIDLSSGIESSVGKKDAEKLRSLMNVVRELREKYGS
jgi:phosphoribosylanthranilate isomerase